MRAMPLVLALFLFLFFSSIYCENCEVRTSINGNSFYVDSDVVQSSMKMENDVAEVVLKALGSGSASVSCDDSCSFDGVADGSFFDFIPGLIKFVENFFLRVRIW